MTRPEARTTNRQPQLLETINFGTKTFIAIALIWGTAITAHINTSNQTSVNSPIQTVSGATR